MEEIKGVTFNDHKITFDLEEIIFPVDFSSFHFINGSKKPNNEVITFLIKKTAVASTIKPYGNTN